MSTPRDAALAPIKLFLACLCACSAMGFTQKAAVPATLSRVQIQAVILAVEDEVYDFSYQKEFYEVGREAGPGVTRLPLYIQPRLKDGEGAVIYKLMPHGEVIRNFHFNKDGLAILEGAPDSGFPPTHPNILTLYMDDDEVCRLKHEWEREYFEILDAPAAERVSEAGERQKKRVGYSAREAPPKDMRKSPPRN